MTYQRYSEREKHFAVKLGNYKHNDSQAEQALGLSAGLIGRWRSAGFGTGEPLSAVDDLLARLNLPRDGTTTGQAHEPPRPIGFAKASQLGAARWDLIWRERFPARALTVIAGAPGLGKSTLEAAIAAELTSEGMTGVISNLEDDAEAVIIPRLMAAGADLERVMLIPREESPRLPMDFGALEQLIFSCSASFVILDPIAAHFEPESRVHNRHALSQLMAIARNCHCAIIGIHHSTKTRNVQINAIEAIGGPQGGLSGAARAVYLYGRDPSDQDRRALACVKINGVDMPATLLVEHETVEVPADGMLLEAGVLNFVEEVNVAAEWVLAPGATRRDRDAECAEWLTEFLASDEQGAKPSNEVRVVGKQSGFSWQTLLRAAIELAVVKAKVGFGPDQLWYWRLPDDHPLRKVAPTAEEQT